MIYKGPYTEVYDEEGYIFPRGKYIAVCGRTFCFLKMGPYKDDFIGISPAILQEPTPWLCALGDSAPHTKNQKRNSQGELR
ncbi:hypothetical protein Noc_0918 [Nitrosococcus oceani ATCC 19707]|uniref:Uncharacterized protein n=2 Tax=Nitrosococcus oceani TaxID=1229 RepID=Q3JCL6_NITOC|nr:hypothetical protein [Nitrosococcus oceani]ABA57430.1 hypothetical protein Noc_0918 [Nitrosococcus oceani ATCC 19707]EDZ67417.1 hypothetical protein NOC27_744 [Nitrosococcus oceani AFC27]KFI20122.1 hypothetical protein IB75_04680 [Nitrosococcus oceani C-27]GEM21447.1 hypothetical protein NONS58_28910 [Nitrosococcus oceani]